MLQVIPLDLDEANALVAAIHRHHQPVRGHRFSLGAIDDEGLLRAAAIVGRPLARAVPDRAVLEVARLASDGVQNGCSILYAAAARAGRALGYETIQTYILESEHGTSLRAAGWELAYETRRRGQWFHNGRARRDDGPDAAKRLWWKQLNSLQRTMVMPPSVPAPPSLFDEG